jgi:hypothetical protein
MRPSVSKTTTLIDVMPKAGPKVTVSVGLGKPRPLTEADAIEIWIARWLRMRPKDIMVRFQCDSRRLYDVWWGQAFPGSKGRAKQVFLERYPSSADRTDFGYRKIPRGGSDPRQGKLL